MSPDRVLRPETLESRFRALEKRLAALERSPQMPNTSIREGAFRVLDRDGRVTAELGQLDAGRYGARVLSADGARRLEVGTDGFLAPRLAGATADPTFTSKETDSATFVTLWRVILPEASHLGVEAFFSWATQTGTTGQIQLVSNVPTATATFNLSALDSGSLFVDWLHGAPLGAGPLAIDIQARRTGGTGMVAVAQAVAWTQNPDLCTSAGVFLEV